MPQKQTVVLAASVPVAIGVCWWLYKQRIKAKTNKNLHSQKLKQSNGDITTHQNIKTVNTDPEAPTKINIASLITENDSHHDHKEHSDKSEPSFQEQVINHETVHNSDTNMTALHISNSLNDLQKHEYNSSKTNTETSERTEENNCSDEIVNKEILQTSAIAVDSAIEVSYENIQPVIHSESEGEQKVNVTSEVEIPKEDDKIEALSYSTESSEYRIGHSDASSEITSTTSNSELNSDSQTDDDDDSTGFDISEVSEIITPMKTEENKTQYEKEEEVSECDSQSEESEKTEAEIVNDAVSEEEEKLNGVEDEAIVAASEEIFENGVIEMTSSWHEQMVKEENTKLVENIEDSSPEDVVVNINTNNNKESICNGTDEVVHDPVVTNGKDSKMKQPTNGSSLKDLKQEKTKERNDHNNIYIEFPSELVGLLIGKQGKNIKAIKEKSNADITVRSVTYSEEVQILDIQGKESSIDEALRLIEHRFPSVQLIEPEHEPTFTLPIDPRSHPMPPPGVPPHSYPVPDISQLHLPEGLLVEVAVSAISDCNKIFVQQYTHPTYYALANLEQAMHMCYNQPNTPALLKPVQLGLVCVVQQGEMWFRAQVIQADEENIMIQFVDYGGFATVPIALVRQIRADLISLPFQAVSCVLDSVAPPEGHETFSEDGVMKLQEMLKEGSFQVCVTNYTTNGEPIVQLYKSDKEKNVISINDALVGCGVASKMSVQDYSDKKCNGSASKSINKNVEDKSKSPTHS